MSGEYPASVLDYYAADDATCAWVRAHAGLSLDEALLRCDHLHVLVRLWSLSDLSLRHVYQTASAFALQPVTVTVTDADAALRRDAREALHRLGRWLAFLPRLQQRRRLRRLRASSHPLYAAVAELLDGAADVPLGAWSRADTLRRDQRDAHVRLLDDALDRCTRLPTDATGGPAQQAAAFRDVLPQQRHGAAAASLTAALQTAAREAIRARDEAARRRGAVQQAPPPAPPSVARVLLTASLFALLFPPGVALISWVWGSLPAFAVGMLLGVVATAVVSLRVGGEAGWMVCALAVFGTIAGAMGGPSILALAFGSGREDVTLAALARDPDAAWYTLSDAIVRGDLEYTRRVTSRDRESGRAYTHDHAIAPLVRASWEPGDPIPAWAYCTSRGSGSRYRRCRALWREPRLGVLPARPLSVGEMEETRRLAAADGPRRQGADAPIFEWVEDPIKHMVRETRVGLGLVGATYLLGVLTLLVRRARAARRR